MTEFQAANARGQFHAAIVTPAWIRLARRFLEFPDTKRHDWWQMYNLMKPTFAAFGDQFGGTGDSGERARAAAVQPFLEFYNLARENLNQLVQETYDESVADPKSPEFQKNYENVITDAANLLRHDEA